MCNLLIKDLLLDNSKYELKGVKKQNPVKLIYHNTANNASAYNEASYMIRNNLKAAFNYVVDDTCAYRCIPDDFYCWNAGHDNGSYGGIAIEIAYSTSDDLEKFKRAEKNAVILGCMLINKWNMLAASTLDEVVTKHQDYLMKTWSNSQGKYISYHKYCPHKTLDLGWNRFIDLHKDELNIEKEAPEPETLYRVQVGAFKMRMNAYNLANELKSKDFATYVVEMNGLYRVQVGAYQVKSNAYNMEEKLNDLKYDTIIVSDNPIEVKKVELKLGDSVKVKADAVKYATGQKIPNFVKNHAYTIIQIRSEKVLLSDINSWVYAADIERV